MDLDAIKGKKSEYADYMVSKINDVISTCGKRFSGSEGETEAALFFQKEMKQFSDETTVESFKVHPKAFYGWVPWTASMIIAAIAATFFIPLLAILFLVVGIVPMLAIFLFYKKGFDSLWKEHKSHNVTAVLKPKGEVKRAVYFSGHIDAAKEWTLNHKLGGKGMVAIVAVGFMSIVYILGIAAFRIVQMKGVDFQVASGFELYLALGSFAFLPAIIAIYWLSDEKFIVDGANDDLSGCLIAVSVLKALKDHNISFENTQIGVILTGSEETGIRGAKAWSEAHYKECNNLPTEIFSLDTICEPEYLVINLKDLNSTVKTSKEVGEKFMAAANALNIKCTYGSVPVGATDAAAYSQKGIPATSIVAMNHDIPKYYHTRADNVDGLNKNCLADVFSICIEVLKNYK